MLRHNKGDPNVTQPGYISLVLLFQSDVFICMELMTTCLDKLMKKLQGPIPEDVLGKISVSVSTKMYTVNQLIS